MNLPNLLTLLRIALTPIFLSLLLQPRSEQPQILYAATGIFCIAALTDALDGYLARKLNQETALGTFLDPVADKAMLLSGFIGILLTTQPVFKLPIWIQILVLFRELVIVIGVITLFLFTGKVHSIPNKLGKVTTVMQMFLIGSCLLNWGGSLFLAYLVAFLTIASGIVYTLNGMKKF